jgi:cation diffusion facilitator CzcD-associated flavoprotein CzcO
MPNLFLFLGPNGGPGAGSFIAMLELVVDYVVKCARKMQIEHISSMEVAYATFPFAWFWHAHGS